MPCVQVQFYFLNFINYQYEFVLNKVADHIVTLNTQPIVLKSCFGCRTGTVFEQARRVEILRIVHALSK